ncbi:hypothetical protein [Tenacibaculum mesophilum]|uniref:hypothetical protein n=1 Tax=Tenacibaculum mesophilum TaxID=104268 RepID=UPI002491C72A|nr:hypothetical protein [Tenacibaculum mesophilum]
MKKRNKQIANLLKLGVFLFGISLLLWNCEKDVKVDSILENKQHRKYDLSIQEKVTITDAQLLKELRIPLNTTSLYKSTNKQLSKNKIVEVNTNEVAIAKTPAYEVYTFPLKNYDTSYDFQNLAVVKREAKEPEYLLLSYLKDNAPKNPNFPYKVYQQSLGNDLDVVFSEKQAKTQSKGADENKCYVLTYLHCGCPGGTSDPSHTAQLCACGTGSKPVLRETICSGNGCGDCPISEDNTPPATNPDAPDPVSPSGNDSSGSGDLVDSGGPIYIYEGEEECFSDGTCTPPLYVPTVLDINLNDILTGEQLLFLSQYPDLEGVLEAFLRANNNSLEAQGFVKQAIKALANGGEVDFDDRIINEIKDEKIKCLHDKLTKDGNTFVKDLLANFEGVSEFNINISSVDKIFSANVNDYVNGETSYKKGDNMIYIKISANKISNNSVLSGIRTILHEYIHADMFRKIYTEDEANSPEVKDFKETYNKFEKGNFKADSQHESMAKLYVNSMATALKEVHQAILLREYNYLSQDGTKSLDNLYEALAWQGLKGHEVQAYTELSDTKKAALTEALNTYFHSLTKNCPQ